MDTQYRGYQDLKVYQLAYNLALEIFDATKSFPPEEKYSLTDQIRRCSRSVCANLGEAWRRRKYKKAVVSKLTDCLSEATETEVWLNFAKDLKYVDLQQYQHFADGYQEVQKMLVSMIDRPDKFCHN